MIDVKIIQQSGQSALVEYQETGATKRVTIPARDIYDGQVNKYNLNLGIPYGVRWSELIELKASSARLEENLHRIGIWTAEDALRDAQKVLGAIQATYQVDLSAILRIAKEARKE